MIQNRNSYIPYKMIVKKTAGLSPMVKSLVLEFDNQKDAKGFLFEPGQFIFVSVLGFGESVLTITSAKHDLPRIEIAVRSVGNNTRALHRLHAGDCVWISDAHGNFFDLQKMAGKEVLVVAGGIGLAPLRSLIRTIGKDPLIVGKTKILVGAKTPQDFIFKADLKKWQEFAEVVLTVDKGDDDWSGHVGKVTDCLKKIQIEKGAVAILCGPPTMFEPTIRKLEKFELEDKNIYLMLERRMKCGMGKCQHCTCGDQYVCLDGPTFTWKEIKDNWEVFA
jgi:NAD(P)H-flavin reductase